MADVLHPRRANVSKTVSKEKLAEFYNVNNSIVIFIFMFRTNFGGKKSFGFGLTYDSLEQSHEEEVISVYMSFGTESLVMVKSKLRVQFSFNYQL